jgi:hypothetical protein
MKYSRLSVYSLLSGAIIGILILGFIGKSGMIIVSYIVGNGLHFSVNGTREVLLIAALP